MDQQTDDCPCKKLRVSDGKVDDGTGMPVKLVPSNPVTNFGDTGQLGGASSDPVLLQGSERQDVVNSKGDTKKTTPSTHSAFWDFGCEASCEISEKMHETVTESVSTVNLAHSSGDEPPSQSPRNTDVEFVTKSDDGKEAHGRKPEDINDIAKQYLGVGTSSELLKLELFTGPKFDLLQKDVDVTERPKGTQSADKDTKSNESEVKKKVDLKRSITPNSGVCDYVHNVQAVTENMHLKSRQDICLVSSIKESIKSMNTTSPSSSKHSGEHNQGVNPDVDGRGDDTQLVNAEEIDSHDLDASTGTTWNGDPITNTRFLQNLLEKSSHQLKKKIPSKSSSLNPPRNELFSMQESSISSAITSFNSTASDSGDEVKASSDIVRPRMVDTGFIEMFTTSVMSSVFSGSSAMGGIASSSTSSWKSGSLNQACGFSGLENVLEDMSAGLPKPSTSKMPNISISNTSSQFSGTKPMLSSFKTDNSFTSHRENPNATLTDMRLETSDISHAPIVGFEEGKICEKTGFYTVREPEMTRESKQENTIDCKQRNKPFELSDECKQVVTTESGINSLPSSILLQVFKHMTIFCLLRRVGLVCKYWYNLCRDPDLWKNINLANQNRLEDNDLCRILQYSEHRVRYINLTDCRFLTNNGIRYLLGACTRLEVLKIVRCSDVTDLAFDTLQLCRYLVSLYLDGNSRLTDTTVKKVSECCPHLRCLHLNHCTKVTNTGVVSLAKNCPHLVELQLNHCCMVSDEAVSEIVLGCPDITCLHLMSCGISDTGVRYLSKLSQLCILDLSHIPRLTADSVIYLSKFCRQLSNINLSLNSTMDDNSLSKVVKNLPNLKHLYCVSCNVTDKGLEDVAKYCPNLEALDAGWCQGVTDDGVRVVSRSCKHLGYFGLIRCDRVTIETVEELELSHPNIKYSTFILESRRLLERARKEGYRFELT